MATTYKVVSGDSASVIAKKYGTTVSALQAANPQYSQFVKNANYIQAGWTLNIPTSARRPLLQPPAPAPSVQQQARTVDVAATNAAREAAVAAGQDPNKVYVYNGDYSGVGNIQQANQSINGHQAADIAIKSSQEAPQTKKSYTELESYLTEILGATAPKTGAGGTTLEQIRTAAEGGVDKPEKVNLASQYETYRTQYGITALETQLNGLNADLENAKAAKAERMAAEGRKTVATNVIAGRKSEVERQEDENIAAIERQINTVNGQLDTKYKVVNTLMNLSGKDYQNAVDEYDKQVSTNINLINTLRGINEEEKNEQQKAQDNARASLQIVYNSIQAGGTSVDALPASTKTLLTKLEVQAGLPAGFYETLTNKNPKAEIVGTYNFTDEENNEVVGVLTKDPATGEINKEIIKLGKAKEKTTAHLFTKSEIAQMQTGGLSVDLANGIYQAIMQGDTLEQIRDDLRANGYSIALLDVFDRVKPIYKILGQKNPNAASNDINSLIEELSK